MFSQSTYDAGRAWFQNQINQSRLRVYQGKPKAGGGYEYIVPNDPGKIYVRFQLGEEVVSVTTGINLSGILDGGLQMIAEMEDGHLVIRGPVATHAQERYGSRVSNPDHDYILGEQFIPGLGIPHPDSNLSGVWVQVYPIWHRGGYLPLSPYQLTPTATSGKKSLCCVGVNTTTNALTQSLTTDVPSTYPALTEDDAADVVAGSLHVDWLFAVELTNGDTSARGKPFIDLRHWVSQHGTLLSDAGTTLTIASGAVTAGNGSFFVLAAESGTTDNLDTITASGLPRDIRIQADAGDTITVKHSTGNIELNGAADFALSGDKTLALFFDGTNWADTSVTGSGSTPTALTVDAAFTQYEQVAVSNTTTPTTLIGDGLGSATLPANTLEQGTVVRIKFFVEQENATTSPNCEFSLTLGGEEVGYIATPSPASPAAGAYTVGEATVVCTASGASGEMTATLIGTDGAGGYGPQTATAAIPVDTTGTLAIDFVATWDTADAGNIATLRTFTVEVLNP